MRRVSLVLCAAACAVALVHAQGGRPAARPTDPADALFDDTQLHDIWIRLSAAELQTLRERAQENTYYRAALVADGKTVANVGVRSRGGATRNGTKPGFQIDFDRYAAGQQFLGLKGLVLDNVWHDPSMLKERLSMLLFRRMGVPAPREAHARLYWGDRREFAGVYAIVEDVDERFLQRNFGEDDGYLFEYERVDDYHFGPLDAPAEFEKRFEPKNHSSESPARRVAALRDFVRVINNATPDTLRDAVAPYLDLDRFLTFVAVQNYLAVWDAYLGDLGMANFSLYRHAGSEKFEFIPWDQDNTFTSLDFPPWYNVHKNVLMRKVWQSAPLRTAYLDRLLAVATAADSWLDQEIAREYQQIRAAALADMLKYQSNADFEAAVKMMRGFARDRARVVREFVARVKADPKASELRNQ